MGIKCIVWKYNTFFSNFFVFCRFFIATNTTGYFIRVPPISPHWVHTALVFYGPGDGISLYFNGSLIGSEFIGTPVSYGESTGIVILGGSYASRRHSHADVTVDELYFWNQPLGAAALQDFYNSY